MEFSLSSWSLKPLRKERKDKEQETCVSASAAMAWACPSQMKVLEKVNYPDLHRAYRKENPSEVQSKIKSFISQS